MPTTTIPPMPTPATIREAVDKTKEQITLQLPTIPLTNQQKENLKLLAFKELDKAEEVADNLLRVEAKVMAFVVPGTMTFDSSNNEYTVAAELALPTVTLPLPGFEDAALVLADSAQDHLKFELKAKIDTTALSASVGLTLSNLPLSMKFAPALLHKMVKKPGGWALASPSDVVIALDGAAIGIDGSGKVTFTLPTIVPSAVQIGSTGIVLDLKAIQILTGDEAPPPDGVPAGSKGVYIASADVYLPPVLQGISPTDLQASQLLIGTGGLSGTIAANWGGGSKPITIGDIACTVHALSFEFKQNTLVDSILTCDLTVPYFDQAVALDVAFSGDGALLATFSGTQPAGASNSGGLVSFSRPNVYDAALEHLSFSVSAGVAKLSVSGTLSPTFEKAALKWPTLEIRELSIDSKGHVKFDGGWTALATTYTFDVHGAKIDVTQFTMGVTDDGGRYIGLNGKIELVKGMSGGASVEGLRLAWHPSTGAGLSFDRIGVSFKSPALEFDGHVSYKLDGTDHKFTGDLKLDIKAANSLSIIGKAVFGQDSNQNKYFAIYIEGDFGTGIPLWATGLSLYGIAGLVAVNYAPDNQGTMPWYSMDTTNSWFHKKDVGATDIVKKWAVAPGTFAIGAGVTIGTAADNGHAFNGKFLLLLLCPGPVLMIDGSANFLADRTAKEEPQFHGLIVLDNRAGYFLVGLDARWKNDKAQGWLADISGSMEAKFNFHDPTDWYLHLGTKDPLERRILASFAKVYTGKAYFMLDHRQLQLGAWIGRSVSIKKGPVHGTLEAYLDANASVNFKPAQFHGDLHLHGYLKVNVFKFELGIGLDATLSADVFKPFHIVGELDILIETKIKNFDLHYRFEWGPRTEPPPLHLPELLPVVTWGVTHPKSSAEWALTGRLAQTPADNAVVPVDARPYVTFGYPMHDAIGVGVNAGPNPGWITIGDPATGAGSARARYALTKIELYRGNQLVAACPNTLPNIGTVYGVWAPALPGSPSGQNKLLIGSKNPLDFTDDTASWNPWLSSNLPGYPCPDMSTEVVCIDFAAMSVGQAVYGAWRVPQNPDFRLNWWYNPDLPGGWTDNGPHDIVPVSPPVQGYDRGLRVGTKAGTKVSTPYHAYVANYNDNNVAVVDLLTRTVIATMAAGTQPVATAVSPDRKRLYVGSTSGDTFIAFDTGTNQRIGNAVAGVARAASIALSPDGARAFVAHGGQATVYAIDLQAMTATPITVGYRALAAALTPDGKKLYVLHPDDGKMTVLNPQTYATLKVIDLGTMPVTAIVFHPSAPRAWIAAATSWRVDPWDTLNDVYVGTMAYAADYSWGRALAVRPNGSAVYAAGQDATKLAVFDGTAIAFNNPVVVDLPNLSSMQLTPDGSMLVATNYVTGTVLTIDPNNKQVVFGPIPASQGGSGGLSLIAAPTIIIDVPAGSLSVDITWAGQGSLSGVVVHYPPAPAVVASSGTTLHIDASALGPSIAAQGIDQIRLSSNLDWTLVRVCATKLRGSGGLPEHQRVVSALNQTVTLWQQPPTLLEAGYAYELRLDWSAEAQGMGELDGWSDAFTGRTVIPFTTALPPSLGTVTDPNATPAVPAPNPPTATGLNDLSLYVIGTSPPTATPAHQLPQLRRPVFGGYDIAVAFGEPYVDEMYRNVGRDLDLLLFDHNGQLVRDAAGPLVIAENAWSTPVDPVLTQTQATWIEMFNTNTCSLQPIDVSKIATTKVLTASKGHVLAPDSVYRARLVPQLVHLAQISGAVWTGLTAQSRDYRVSVLVKLTTSDVITIRFRSSGGNNYEFSIDPARNLRTLTKTAPGQQIVRPRVPRGLSLGSQVTILGQDRFVYNPGSDDPYRIHIEAVGSALLVAQNDAVVFAVTDAALAAGAVELHQPASQSVFSDLAISDLGPNAPVAYSFAFTTGVATNFYHLVHGFQDRQWTHDVAAALNLGSAVASTAAGDLGVKPEIGDAEQRAYEKIATLALGSSAAQDAAQLDVTRLTNGGAVLGWLVRSPEPLDPTRTAVSFAASSRVLAAAERPGIVKISEAELGEPESITLLARGTVDLSGYSVQRRYRPSALAEQRSSQILAQGGNGAGDASWTDYRVSAAFRTSLPGAAGLRFRIQDANNYYAFAYDALTGMQQLLKVAGATTTVLASVQGDPSPGQPVAPLVRLAVSLHGAKIAGYRAGKLVISASDGAFAAGGAAVWAGSNPIVVFEAFEVRRLPNEAYALFTGQATTSSTAGWQSAPGYAGLLQSGFGDLSWGDVIVRARTRRTTSSGAGLLFRYQDGANHYRLLFTNVDRRLERVAGGVVTSLWTSPVPLDIGRVYELVISFVGSALRVYQDTALVCEVVDAALATGSLGLCAWPGVTLDFPQIVIYPASAAFSEWAAQQDFTPPVTFVLANMTASLNAPLAPLSMKKTKTTMLPGEWGDVRVVVATRAQSGGLAGVMFGYRDDANFYRFSMPLGGSAPQLTHFANSGATVLWTGAAALDPAHAYALTLDVCDGVLSARLDGVRLFELIAPDAIRGAIGLISPGDAAATFSSYRIGVPGWADYYTFGPERRIAAGTRVKVTPATGTTAPNRRTSIRVAAELDDAPFRRLVPDGARLRVVAPDGTVQHARDVVPASDFAKQPFKALRKADGTGLLIAPVTPVDATRTIRVSFDYERDNDVVAFTEAGEAGDEVAFIDVPPV